MALSLIINRFDPYKIEELEIDTALSEIHTYGNEVTDYPIEDGSNINDHIKREPEKLTIEGITTNTPIQFFGGRIGNFVRGDFTNRAQLAFNILLGYAGYEVPKQIGKIPERVVEPKIISIVTGYKTYTDMVIEQLTFPRESLSGEAARYSVSFKKIKKVQALATFIVDVDSLNNKAPNIKDQAAKNINAGKEATQDVNEGSVLFNLTKSLKGKLLK